MVVSQTSSLSSPSGGRRLTPAELTRMSGSPKTAAACSATSVIPVRVLRSPLTQAARQPSAVSSSTVATSSASLRATITTLAPARARAPAMARPIPELPPVTRAVRPSREKRPER